MLRLRKRGRYWHIRGTVRVGQDTIAVEETTGCADRQAADAVLEKRRAEILDAALYGDRGRARHLTFDDAAAAFVDRQKTPHRSDLIRVGRLAEHFSGFRLDTIDQAAWNAFCRERMPGRAPGSLDRYRTVLRTIYAEVGLEPPAIDRPRYDNRRIRWLDTAMAEVLLGCYAPHVAGIATVLAFNGSRVGETLRLDESDVDLEAGPAGMVTFRGDQTKTSRPRRVPLHPRSRDAILAALARKEQLHRGARRLYRRIDPVTREETAELWSPVFVNRLGDPYHDSRQIGGNPISKAHATAWARAHDQGVRARGGADFHVHDWRHHWATWFLRKGGDTLTLMKLGGWTNLQSVQRYVEGDLDAAYDQLSKL